MKNLAILAVAFLPLAAVASDDRNWKYEDQETISRNFDLTASSARKLLVDNRSGAIHVTGYNGSQVQITVQKKIRAWSNEALAEGKRDVKLDMSQQGNFVRLYADGPFRSDHYRGDDYYGYHVTFEYQVQVPADTELELKNTNSGIDVKHTTGPFDVHGLNGSISMDDVSGSGVVNTLNGPVKVTFTRNPEHDSEFHTLNGRIDVYFQPPLNADLHFQTLNGGVYSDFDVTALPIQVSGSTGSQDGRFLYRSHRNSGSARAGKGGPSLSFHTLNGRIELHSKAL